MTSQQLLIKTALFILPLLFLLHKTVTPLYAIKTNSLQQKEVLILFEEPLRAAAEDVASIYPVLKKDLEETLGWHVNFRPTVTLIGDSSFFHRLAGSDFIAAFAVPQKKLIVIDYSRMTTDPFTIDLILKHELCHLLLHDLIKGHNLPKWLDEGVTQWVSDGMAEIISNQEGSVLDEAILSGKYISIGSLTTRFPRDRKRLMLAYEESKSLVEYIISKWGRDGILTLLEHLKDGKEVDQAILMSLSISFDELEHRWYNHLKKRITWVTYLINHLYEFLFSIAALILIIGFIRVVLKKRAYEEEEETL